MKKHFFSWNNGEPNNAGGDANNLVEGCVQIKPEGLNDCQCSTTLSYICEMNLLVKILPHLYFHLPLLCVLYFNLNI